MLGFPSASLAGMLRLLTLPQLFELPFARRGVEDDDDEEEDIAAPSPGAGATLNDPGGSMVGLKCYRLSGIGYLAIDCDECRRRCDIM